MAHFAHYLRRQLVRPKYRNPEAPWFARNAVADQGLAAPSYHITGSRTGPATRIGPGDVIWLFAQLFTPWGSFPPALDAKIVVAEVIEPRPPGPGEAATEGKPWTFRYRAGPGSRWFPMADASPLLQQLRTTSSKGICPLISSTQLSAGQALQSIREIADPAPLMEHESALDEAGYDFVSYRLTDGTEASHRHALRLVTEAARPIFWDRWSLPRGLAERREFLEDEGLRQHIRDCLEKARTVWSIDTPEYGAARSYSEFEKAVATGFGKLVPAPAASGPLLLP